MATLAFWRDGLVKQVAALVILTVMVVMGGSWLAGRSTQKVLGRVVDQYTGDGGRYDLLVQLQVGAGATRHDLEQLLARELPGARLFPGVTLGGQENDFVSLPDELIRPDVLESLDRVLGQLPGYSGYTLLMQPVLTLGRVQSPWRSTVQRLAASQTGVRLTFWHGNDLVVLLRDARAATPVRATLTRWLNGRTLFRLQLPSAYELAQADEVASRIARRWQALHPHLPLVPITGADRATGNGTAEMGGSGTPAAGEAGPAATSAESLQSVGRLLDVYLTRVWLPVPHGQTAVSVQPGQQWLIQPNPPDTTQSAAPPSVPGRPGSLPTQAVLAQVVTVTPRNPARPSVVPTATAVVVQGRWSGASGGRVYVWKDGQIGPELGRAEVSAPRQQLAQQLEQLSTWVQAGGATVPSTGDRGAGGATPSPSGGNLAQTLADVDQVLAAVQALPGQLNQVLAQTSADQQNQLLSQLALEALGRRILGTGDNSGLGGGIDPGQIGQLRQQLGKLQKGLTQLNGPADAKLPLYLDELVTSLRQMDDGELGRSWLTLQAWQAESSAAAPGQVAWWGSPSIRPAALQALIRRELGEESLGRVVTLPIATLVPDARTELLQMAERSGQLVGVLAAGLLTLLALLLDQATLLATWKGVLRAKTSAARRRHRWAFGWLPGSGPALYGLGIGALLLVNGALAATGGHPSPSTMWGALGGGALLGLAVAWLAERLSPVASDQVLAGESLALSYRQIMTEIVVPAGRPGLYQLLVAGIHRWARSATRRATRSATRPAARPAARSTVRSARLARDATLLPEGATALRMCPYSSTRADGSGLRTKVQPVQKRRVAP